MPVNVNQNNDRSRDDIDAAISTFTLRPASTMHCMSAPLQQHFVVAARNAVGCSASRQRVGLYAATRSRRQGGQEPGVPLRSEQG